MKQQIRLNTFETNSSSVHTLQIISKEEFEKFESKETFFDLDSYTFKSFDEIPNLDRFLEYYPDFETLSDFDKECAIKEFREENFNSDYPAGLTSGGSDYVTETCYDKDGNEKVAISFYCQG